MKQTGSMKTGTVNMVIDGGWVCEIARRKLVESGRSAATRWLRRAVRGITIEQARDILDGAAALTGDTGAGITLEYAEDFLT